MELFRPELALVLRAGFAFAAGMGTATVVTGIPIALALHRVHQGRVVLAVRAVLEKRAWKSRGLAALPYPEPEQPLTFSVCDLSKQIK